jgi:hypothetical protein
MPILIRKVRNKDCWRVVNAQTKHIHSYCTTLANAKAQKRLLDSLEMRGGMLPNNPVSIRGFARWIKDYSTEFQDRSIQDLIEGIEVFTLTPESSLSTIGLRRKRIFERLYDEYTAMNSGRIYTI